MISFLTDITVDGVALWVVLLICVGVFLGAFMDAIAGGGGIITVPTYLMGLSNLPIYNALGTNKLSSGIGTIFSTARFIHQGLVDWKLFAPAVILSLTGSVCGTWPGAAGTTRGRCMPCPCVNWARGACRWSTTARPPSCTCPSAACAS